MARHTSSPVTALLAVTCAGLVAAHIGTALAAQTAGREGVPQSAAPQAAVPVVPEVPDLHTSPIVSSSARSLVVIGTARHDTEDLARRWALENALYRTASEMTRRLFDDPRRPVVSFRDLMDYARRFTRQTGVQTRSTRGGIDAYVRVELNAVFLDPVRLRNLGRTRPVGGVAEGYLLVPTREFLQRVTGGKAPATFDVRVQADSVRAGSFQFGFTAARVDEQRVRLRLDTIVVEEDGSAGSATWEFTLVEVVDVVTGRMGPRPLLTMAARSYNDDVRLYPVNAEFDVTVASGSPTFEVQIVGRRR